MKKILIVVLFLSLFIITGCANNNIVGSYKVVEIVEENKTFNEKELKKYNINYTIIVNKDKTAVLNTDSKEKLKYDDKYFYSMKDSSDKIIYSYKDNKLILNVDELKITFKKK